MATDLPCILLVEDDHSFRAAIERLLRAADYHVVSYGDAEAMLESGAISGALCLIADVHLPGMTGFELHDRIVRVYGPLRTIFITAYDDAAARRHAQMRRGSSYLPKPFQGRALLTLVEKLLENDIPTH
jgi:FixJ family two-component response regulator